MGLNLGIKRRTLLKLAWGALALLAAAAAFDGARLMADERINAQIASGALPPEDPEAPAELRFAQACAQAASGAGIMRGGPLREPVSAISPWRAQPSAGCSSPTSRPTEPSPPGAWRASSRSPTTTRRPWSPAAAW